MKVPDAIPGALAAIALTVLVAVLLYGCAPATDPPQNAPASSGDAGGTMVQPNPAAPGNAARGAVGDLNEHTGDVEGEQPEGSGTP